MTFDQALSPRLAQRTAPEQPGIRLATSASLPESAPDGMLVYLTDTGELQVYYGDAWTPVSGGGGGTPPPSGDVYRLTIDTNPPTSPVTKDLWLHPGTQVLKVYNAGVWTEVWDSRVASLVAGGTGIKHFVQGSQPWSNGDATHDADFQSIWTNTNAGNAHYYWTSGRVWSLLLHGQGSMANDSIGTAQLQPSAISSKHTLTGPTLQTASSGQRLVWAGTNPRIEVYATGGDTAGRLESVTVGGNPTTRLSSPTSATYPTQSRIDVRANTGIDLVGEVTTTAGLTTGAGVTVNGQLTVTNAINLGADINGNAHDLNNIYQGNFNRLGTVSGVSYIHCPELRPSEVYLRNLPVGVSGNAIFMGANGRLYMHSSAKKYKKHIKKMTTELVPTILALEPVTYDFRTNAVDPEVFDTDGTDEIGFLADDAADLGLEQLVGRGDDGQVETFHYYKLPIYQQLVIRAQQAEIEDLKEQVSEIALLKEQLDVLTAQVGALTGPGD